MSVDPSAPPVLRVRVYDVAPFAAVHDSVTLASPDVAVRVGTDGGTHTGLAETSAEGADRQDPLLAYTT
jgi:hypothetical protein